MLKRLAVASGLVSIGFVASVLAQGTNWQFLNGGNRDLGLDGGWNVSWIDLTANQDFRAGQKLSFDFGSQGPSEIVVRFVPQNCSYESACQLDCSLISVVSGKAVYTITQTHANIKQVSVHSGVNGRAFACQVQGGPMTRLVSVSIQ